MIELYKMYLRVHWKIVLICPGIIFFFIIIHSMKNGFALTDSFAGSTEMSGVFALFAGMLFYNSFANNSTREMGIDSIALLPIDRIEVAYIRYLLPLTVQLSVAAITIFYPIMSFDLDNFLLITRKCLQFILLGNIILAFSYLLSNLLENFQKKVRWFQVLIGVGIALTFVNHKDLPILDFSEIFLLAAFAGGLVAVEIFTFQRFRTFRIS